LVVTAEGFPLSYEVFEGNRADVSTLEDILDSVERKHGSLGRVWVFDRGIVSEENLELLRRRGASYLVATPRRKLAGFEQELLKGEWAEVSGRPDIEVKLIERDGELYVLSRSRERAEQERSIRLRALHGLRKDLKALSKRVRTGRLRQRDLILLRLGRLEERWPNAWAYLKKVELTDTELVWRWDRKKLRTAWLQQGAYLLRTNLSREAPETLWRQYLQLTEVEAVFRTLKSALKLRPIWHSDPMPGRSPHPGGLPGLLLVGLFEAKAQSRRRQPDPGAGAAPTQADPVGRSLVCAAQRRSHLPAPDHPTRRAATPDPAPLGLVIAGATAAQNLPRPGAVCVDDLTG
jgi:hypothetical protein